MDEIERLIRTLADGDRTRRGRAVARLVETGEPAVLPLCEAVTYGGLLTRCAALTALGRIGDPRAIGTVCKALRDPERSVRERAATALAELGSAAPTPALREALHKGTPLSRTRIAAVLYGLGDRTVIPQLCSDLRSMELGLRLAAVRVLGSLGDRAAVPGLCRSLRDPVLGVRTAAAEALGRIGDPAAVAFLCECPADDTPEVQAARVQAAAGMGARAIPGLVHALNVDSGLVARQALVRIGAPAVEPLCAAVVRGGWGIRRHAAEVLGRIGDPRAASALSAALRDRMSDVRGQAALSLGGLREAAALAPLEAAARDDPAETVRVRAAIALALLGRAELSLVPNLIGALRDGEPAIRQAAADTLARVAAEDPAAGLRLALPHLRRLCLPWSFEADDVKWSCRAAIAAIEGVTAATKDLPVPARPGTFSDESSLPVPGQRSPS